MTDLTNQLHCTIGQILPGDLRGQLEVAVRAAREAAEAGAQSALFQLGVAEGESPAHLDELERQVRRRLRAHARFLGDLLGDDGVQELQRLIWESAYEQWHRMLFARFLSERNLLIWEGGVSVTLDECHEMAGSSGAELGVRSGWELAGRLAERMLPQLFRPDSPVLALRFAPEHQQVLERLLDELPQAVFLASDSLGWAYQFWQGKRKEEVNAAQVKVGADELPPVTQLFTEPYMVEYLLHNTLGSTWRARYPALAERSPLRYLVTSKAEDSVGVPIRPAESFASFKLLDPCCGSGHFLVAALHLLVPMRVLTEGLSIRDAVDAVLAQNLHGVELDLRCVEIAAFALALAAWSYPDEHGRPLGYRSLPALNLACAGRAPSRGRASSAFSSAPLLGSLLPVQFGAAQWEQALIVGNTSSQGDEEGEEYFIAAQGFARAAALLRERYDVVVTNPPFLGRGRMCDALREYVEAEFYEARHDLGAVFLEYCLRLGKPEARVGCVLQQSWLFAGSYAAHRRAILQRDSLLSVANLGEGAFRSVDAAGAFPSLLVFERVSPDEGGHISVVDVAMYRTADEKAAALELAEPSALSFAQVSGSSDYLVAVTQGGSLPPLSEFATPYVGLQTSDYPRYCRFFWELPLRTPDWEYMQESPEETGKMTGLSSMFYWQNGSGDLVKSGLAYIRGQAAWGKKGVAVSRMRQLEAGPYFGNFYNQTTAAIIPHDESLLPAVMAFCASDEYTEAVHEIDRRICVANAALGRVGFDLPRWQAEAERQFPNGLPAPYTEDPTQWLFHGHPASSTDPLQVAVARLLGYRWPAECDDSLELSDATRVLKEKCAQLASHADDDGVVCLPPVRGEKAAHERLLNLLIAAWESAEPGSWKTSVLAGLLAEAGCSGRTLETWLKDKFFEQHARVFKHRPFIWHVWDGLQDGFAALVNYHKLDARLLDRLTHTYLGDWIRTQEGAASAGVDGAQLRVAAAKQLKTKLEAIAAGEAPYDIFVRWKPVEKQSVGWSPDLNDGVRLNIRPFMKAEVLRHNRPPKLNVKWETDRGQEPTGTPWGEVFRGKRVNEHHIKLAEKHIA